jgi:cell surface protein SprA
LYSILKGIIPVQARAFLLLAVSMFFQAFWSENALMAQVTGDSSSLRYPIRDRRPNDPNRVRNNVDLRDPIDREIRYNPATGRYEEYRRIGDLWFPTGETRSFEDFVRQENQNRNRDYFRQRSQQSYASGSGTTDGWKPRLNITNPELNRIFGDGGVDIQPSGSATVTLGGNFNTIRNPQFSKRQQRNGNFIFDQKIQLNVMGNIGNKVKLGIRYDTDATFEFDNQTNLGWSGREDDILKEVSVGNVSLPLNSSLINAGQSLFGIKTRMQFGRLSVATIFTQQKGQTTETEVTGGAQLTEFNLQADNYDQNRHFFLSHFFRDQYENALRELPIVNSPIIINRVEIWVTNRNADVATPRDVLALMDLGEANPWNAELNAGMPANQPAYNDNNRLWSEIQMDPAVRNKGTSIDKLNTMFNGKLEQGLDYDILNYARQLNETEFTLNRRLGYISLNTALNNDEILAVAFEYSYNGRVFQVGEFSRDVPPDNQNVMFLKMLKSPIIRTRVPIWDLMMKNIYNLNTYNLSTADFKLNIIYADDTSGADYNFLPVQDVPVFADGNPLLRVFGLDRVNRQQEAKPDGIFDAIEDVTIQAQHARIIFPVLEPFGRFLRTQFGARTDLADYYAFDALYDSTKWLAQQDVKHNKFFLQGSFKGSSSSQIPVGGFNLRPGSVKVFANGRQLAEGTDYTVDYGLGMVNIINQGLLQSGAVIKVSTESQALFNIQQKTLVGSRLDYKVNDKLLIGGTIMHMYERPLVTKTNINEEPLLNTIFGLDLTYNTKSRWLTRMIDKLPFLETKEISSITMNGEYARIIPHNFRSQGRQRGISNIDDFENAEVTNDLKMFTNWTMASIPQKQENLFPETGFADKRRWLEHHGRLAYYTIDPLFYQEALMPANVKSDPTILSNHYMLQVDQRFVFPSKQFPAGTPTILPTLDLFFDPLRRGQYNFNTNISQLTPDGLMSDPRKSWAGIMRRIETNDFEAANIDYIEIWMLDPFIYEQAGQENSGELYINLGNISEDILPDRRKSFENGFDKEGLGNNEERGIFGFIPTVPTINNAFENDDAARLNQDKGLDGMNNVQERQFWDSAYLKPLRDAFGESSLIYQQALNDPAGDDYLHYLEGVYDGQGTDILQRYSRFNMMEGNSTTERYPNGQPKAATLLPNDEDINRDFTMNQSEDYFQYRIKLSRQDLRIGQNYVADTVRTEEILLRNGRKERVTWYQFKIPIRQFEKAVGNISDFKSIRFMRMFMTGFNQPVVLRFGYINMVRAEWRRHLLDLKKPGVIVPTDPDDDTRFVVSTVNVEENSKRLPIPYVTPPGVQRVQNQVSMNTTLENEQALSLLACNLKAGDARGAFKTTQFDIRNYKRLQMFVHAESETANDGDLTAFIRFGTDLTNNYYEYEIPLTFTRWPVPAVGRAEAVWPAENFMDLALDLLYEAKLKRQAENWPMSIPYTVPGEKGRITVLGLPDVGNMRVMMLGIRNVTDKVQCGEVWFNELRVQEIANGGGWAALGRVNAQLADFGNVNLSSNIKTIGFGGIDKKLNERSLTNNYMYDFTGNFEMGKFFPRSSGISIPIFLGWTEGWIRPKFNPLNPDVLLSSTLRQLEGNPEEYERVKRASEDYTSRYSINFTNIRKNRTGGGKMHLWDIENFNVSYSYQKFYQRNQQIEEFFTQTYRGSLGYNFNPQAKFIKPFTWVKPKSLRAISDFNLNLIPTALNARLDIDRFYSESQARNNSRFRQITPRLYDKNFTMTRFYTFNLPLTQALTINYTATANARIEEPFGPLDTEAKRDSVRQEVLSLGRLTQFNQVVNASYNLPFNKIGLLNWINATTTYAANFGWSQAPPAFPSLGNNIQNSRDLTLNGTLNFNQLYSKVPFLRKLESKPPTLARPGMPPAKPSGPAKPDENKPKMNPALKVIGKTITMVKNGSINYTDRRGTVLPGFGYLPEYIGNNFSNNAPGLPFIAGWQDENIRYRLANSGALSADSRQANPYSQTQARSLQSNFTVEPVGGFRVQFDFDKQETRGMSSLFKWNDTNWVDQGLTENGSYSVTSIFWRTAFVKDGPKNVSATFEQFMNNRFTVAQRMQFRDERVAGTPTDPNTGFPLGYSPIAQDVLIQSFFSAYRGSDAGRDPLTQFPRIPLPSWNINFNGLSRIKAIQNIFSNITLMHRYQGRYQVSSFNRNLGYDPNQRLQNTEDFVARFQINDVTINESFSPLIGIQVSTKNNWTFNTEYKKMRTVRLMVAQFNVTELRTEEFQFRIGYRKAGIILPAFIKYRGKRAVLENDLRFDATISIQDNKTILRKIDNNLNNPNSLNEPTAGAKLVLINPMLNYQVNQKVNLQAFYTRRVNKPVVTTSFPTAITDFGVKLQYTIQ